MSRGTRGLKADISRIERARHLRQTRESRPFLEFQKRVTMHLNGQEELKAKDISAETRWLFKTSFVTGIVTATEVYFRDMLEAIFRTCKPEVFLSKLSDLHESKYGIDDLISIYVKRVHPCELILSDLSFQRVETIEKVFSSIMGKPFWKSVVPVEVRVKEEPTTETKIKADVVGSYERLLQLRHELTHNPDAEKRHLSEEEESWISGTVFLIFACDIRFTSFISGNMDPDLKKERQPKPSSPDQSKSK